MGEGIVARVGRERGAQEGWQVLVGNDVLQGGDVQPPGPLEQLLVCPGWVLSLESPGQHVVPPIEQDGEGEEGRILVYPEQKKLSLSHQL